MHSSVLQAKDARGERPFAPRMMLALLIYGYAVGVFSSRKIERAPHEDIAFRVLAGGGHPHFTTINEFRLRDRSAFDRAPKRDVQRNLLTQLENLLGAIHSTRTLHPEILPGWRTKLKAASLWR